MHDHECSFKLYTKCTINNKVYSAVQFGFSNQFSWEGDNNMYLFTMKYLFLNTNMHANSIYLAFEQYPSLIINFRYLFLWQKQINKNISWLVGYMLSNAQHDQPLKFQHSSCVMQKAYAQYSHTE